MAGGKRADIQNLTKSCNEVLVLAFLREGPKHGYQLALHSEETADRHRRGGRPRRVEVVPALRREGAPNPFQPGQRGHPVQR